MGRTRLIWIILVSWTLTTCSASNGNLDTEQDASFLTKGVYPLEMDKDLDVVLNQVGNSQYVLLGEASHGTAEFYTWRAELTKRLVQEKGFTLIAVEGDWPAAYQLNQYVRGQGGTSVNQALQGFQRWPSWMWANQEIADLGSWLRTYNSGKQPNQQAGFYGMDVYSLWESLDALETYLKMANPAAAQLAREAQQCFGTYNRDEQSYAQATAKGTSCAPQLQRLLEAVRAHRAQQPAGNEAALNAEQNALVAVNAERYYHQMVRSSANSWNVRDRHMQETVNRLVSHHGANAKIIIWAHNTHVGDARFTDMASAGMVNIGQLLREQHEAKGVYIVGLGTYQGAVIAATNWGGALQTMNVPAAKAGSWEAILHRHGATNKILLMSELKDIPEAMQTRGHRAIGVQYNPRAESGNYVPTILPRRYDAFLYIDQTTALHPLPIGTNAKVAPPLQGKLAQIND